MSGLFNERTTMQPNHKMCRALFDAVAKLLPTVSLQTALRGREGVTVIPVRHDEIRSIDAIGPCVVTVNHV